MIFFFLDRIVSSVRTRFSAFTKLAALAILWKIRYNRGKSNGKGCQVMSEEFGPTFVTITDEDGQEIVLEFVDALEYNGQQYQAFFPVETEDEEADEEEQGLVILKVIHEDGEDLLSTLDSDEELDAVYDLFMESLFGDEEE